MIGILFSVCFLSSITYLEYLNTRTQSIYSLEVKEVNQGWAYEIYFQDKLVIRQKTMPGVANKIFFSTRKDAEKVGHLVINKLNKRESPSISREELISEGIDIN